MNAAPDPAEHEGVRTASRVLMYLTALLVVIGVIVGVVMASSGADCSTGSCHHPHAGAGGGLVIVSLLLGVIAVLANLILVVVVGRRDDE